jgi:hypothetical protein
MWLFVCGYFDSILFEFTPVKINDSVAKDHERNCFGKSQLANSFWASNWVFYISIRFWAKVYMCFASGFVYQKNIT